VLVRVLNAFYRFTARRRGVLFADRQHGKASATDHRRLFKHIVNRDVAKAEAAILRHMDRARSYWSVVLGPPGSRGK
jgi:GntR family transcriptional repressor for pyruvate dehydrogenase complex